MPILLSEYENQNSHRRYPFEDNATLLDGDGNVLSNDFIIDASLYPIDLPNNLYLSMIDQLAQVLYFADTVTGQVYGTASYSNQSAWFVAYNRVAAPVFDTTYPDRQVGVVVFGPGLAELVLGGQQRTFSPNATTFSPVAVTPMRQRGVRGFVLEDGSLIHADVVFVPGPGVNISSNYVVGQPIVRFDIVGTPATPEEECTDLPPVIQKIQVYRAPCSAFVITKLDAYVLALTPNQFDQEDVCEAVRGNQLPDVSGHLPLEPHTGDDPCGSSPLPWTPSCGPSQDEEFDISLGPCMLLITTPSAAGMANPIRLDPVDQDWATTTPRIKVVEPVTGGGDLASAVAAFSNPPKNQGGLLIELRGIGLSRQAEPMHYKGT